MELLLCDFATSVTLTEQDFGIGLPAAAIRSSDEEPADEASCDHCDENQRHAKPGEAAEPTWLMVEETAIETTGGNSADWSTLEELFMLELEIAERFRAAAIALEIIRDGLGLTRGVVTGRRFRRLAQRHCRDQPDPRYRHEPDDSHTNMFGHVCTSAMFVRELFGKTLRSVVLRPDKLGAALDQSPWAEQQRCRYSRRNCEAREVTMERPDGIVDFEPESEFFPFESRWFDSSAGPIHYIDEGRGKPLLLLHGNPDWSFLYRKIVVGLRDRFRCVAMDYPGFGLSVHPDDSYGYTSAEHAVVVRELVEHLDLADMVVMGQDWGGPIGMDVASRMPERISGLVMGNTWFWPAGSFMLNSFSRLMGSPPLQALITKRNFFVTPLMKRSLNLNPPF